MTIPKQVDARTLMQRILDSDTELDIDVFAVNKHAVRDEYQGEDDEPVISYDAESWRAVERVYVDTDTSPSAVIIVYEGDPIDNSAAE